MNEKEFEQQLRKSLQNPDEWEGDRNGHRVHRKTLIYYCVEGHQFEGDVQFCSQDGLPLISLPNKDLLQYQAEVRERQRKLKEEQQRLERARFLSSFQGFESS